jgi:hypothetical protein
MKSSSTDTSYLLHVDNNSLEPTEEAENIKFTLDYEANESIFGAFLKSYQKTIMVD